MLGLILHLAKHHFQSDLKLVCASTFSKQIAHSHDQVTFATQNAESLLRSSNSLSSSNNLKINKIIFMIFNLILVYQLNLISFI